MGSPFSVGYEATFEHAYISFFEKSTRDSVETECCVYTHDKKEKVIFEPEEHCKALLKAVIEDFSSDKDSGLGLESALPGLSLALSLSNPSSIKR